MTGKEQDECFEDWMGNHQGVVQKVARLFADSPAEQEDLAQEIRVAIWKSIPGFDGNSKSATYCYRIALNRAISWQRSRRSYREKVNRYADHVVPTLSASKPDPRLELVYGAIRTLDRAERSLILMYLEGFRYDEIAETLGLTSSNVGVRINRIKTKLSRQLKGKRHEH